MNQPSVIRLPLEGVLSDGVLCFGGREVLRELDDLVVETEERVLDAECADRRPRCKCVFVFLLFEALL